MPIKRLAAVSTPLPWVIGPAALLGCVYLFWSPPLQTRMFFLIWNVIGLGCHPADERTKAAGGAGLTPRTFGCSQRIT